MSESHVKELIGQLFYSDTRQVCLVVSSGNQIRYLIAAGETVSHWAVG